MAGQINPPMLVRYRDGGFANCVFGVRTLIFNLVPRYNGRILTLDLLTFHVNDIGVERAFYFELVTEEFTLENGYIIVIGNSEKSINLPRYKVSFSRNIGLYVTHQVPAVAYDVSATIEGEIDF